jgi:hypothetical protein
VRPLFDLLYCSLLGDTVLAEWISRRLQPYAGGVSPKACRTAPSSSALETGLTK